MTFAAAMLYNGRFHIFDDKCDWEYLNNVLKILLDTSRLHPKGRRRFPHIHNEMDINVLMSRMTCGICQQEEQNRMACLQRGSSSNTMRTSQSSFLHDCDRVILNYWACVDFFSTYIFHNLATMVLRLHMDPGPVDPSHLRHQAWHRF